MEIAIGLPGGQWRYDDEKPIVPEMAKRLGLAIPDVPVTIFGILNISEYPMLNQKVSVGQRVPGGTGDYDSDRKQIFHGNVGDSFPGMGPTMLDAKAQLYKDRDNWFFVVISSRTVTLTEKIVISWNGASWEHDYELIQQRDDDRGNEERIIRQIRDDFPYITKAQ